MKTNSYIPQPIDTSDVTLPAALEQLVEQMARNVHEVWAESRISQGWTYGAQRDARQKTHPCLVPYDGNDQSINIMLFYKYKKSNYQKRQASELDQLVFICSLVI